MAAGRGCIGAGLCLCLCFYFVLVLFCFRLHFFILFYRRQVVIDYRANHPPLSGLAFSIDLDGQQVKKIVMALEHGSRFKIVMALEHGSRFKIVMALEHSFELDGSACTGKH